MKQWVGPYWRGNPTNGFRLKSGIHANEYVDLGNGTQWVADCDCGWQSENIGGYYATPEQACNALTQHLHDEHEREA